MTNVLEKMSDAAVVPTPRRYAIILAIALVVMLLADQAILWVLEWVQLRPAQITTSRVIRQQAVEGIMLGMFASQLLLAVAYSALGDGSSLRRILWTTVVLAVFTNTLVLTNVLFFGSDWGTAVSRGYLIPLAFFFWLQIPLWGVRSWSRCRIRSPWMERNQHRHAQFSLAQMLIWAVFVAIPLGIVQTLSAPGIMQANSEFLWGIVLLTFFSCLFVLWCLTMALTTLMGESRWLIAIGLPIAVALATSINSNWSSTALAVMMAASAAVEMLICFQIAHRLGFRFVRLGA
jgi:hypothetical protein